MFGRNQSDDEAIGSAEPDTEFTLGPGLLMALVIGLLLLCATCLYLGYSIGHRGAGSGAKVATSATGQTITASSDGAIGKPPASGIVPAVAAQQTDTQPSPSVVPSPSGNALQAPGAAAGNGEQNSPAAANALVRPAFTGSAPEPSSPGSLLQPAAPRGGIMVQVAAVSNPQDASVLVDALRKRGYAAAAYRASNDSYIHVQVGPFTDRNDANAAGQRLLGDGYNAQVIP